RYPQMASLVKHGRVEAAIVSSIEGIAPFNWPDWATLAISEPLEQFELFHYIHYRHHEEAGQLAGILEQMSESGWTGTAISQFIDSHSDKVIISGNFPWPQGE